MIETATSLATSRLPLDWRELPFDACIEEGTIERTPSVQQGSYKAMGQFPVVDQGSRLVSGYTDDANIVHHVDLPIILFGDHTRILKFLDFPFATGADGTKLFRAKDQAVEPKFLYFALLHLDIPSRGYNRHFKYLKEKTIAVPDRRDEQQAIAAVLSKIQKAAEIQEKIVATLKELKLATMAKLFREGLRGEPRKQTEIGEIPESWEVVRLGDGCSYTTGKLNSEKAVEHGEYPFFTCSQETFRINSFSFDQEALLLAGNNAQGKYSVKHYRGKFDAYQRTYVISIKDTSRLNYRFLLHELARKLELLRRNSLGATTKYLTASVISSLEIAKPRLEEQENISNILSVIDDRIGNGEKRHTILKSLFASMLHLLMTGQVRVKSNLATKNKLPNGGE